MRWILLVTVLLGSVAAARECSVLVVGDSLSAAYGIAPESGWVDLLAERAREAHGCDVVNASVSGETTSGGLARLPRALDRHHPSAVVIELGGNDGLRGLPVTEMRANLRRMIELSRASGARVLITGIRIPPNYGFEYTGEFHAVYLDLARELDAALVPHLLEDVALDPNLMQEDGIHPNAQAQPLIMERVWARLDGLLTEKSGD